MKINRENIESALLGESIGEARIGGVTIHLPAPILTSTDINYADAISREYRTTISYPHKIYEIKFWWNDEFAKKSRTEIINYINTLIGKARANSSSEVHICTPLIPLETQITKSFIESFVETQIKSELDVVNILDSLKMPLPEIKEIVKENSKKIIDAGKEPFFLTSMAQKKEIFEAKLNAVKDVTNGITALYANPLKHYDKFSTIANMKNEEGFLRIISNVERIYPKQQSGAVMPLIFLCADLFSSKLGFGGKKDASREVTNAKRLDTDLLGHLTIAQHRREHGEALSCLCPIDDGNEMSDLQIDYRGYLNEAFRTHEPFAVFDVVEEIRDSIYRNKLVEFLKKKKYAQRPLMKLFHINLVDSTLTN